MSQRDKFPHAFLSVFVNQWADCYRRIRWIADTKTLGRFDCPSNEAVTNTRKDNKPRKRRTFLSLVAEGGGDDGRDGLIQVEKIYDGSQRETRDLAAYYARGHDLGDEAIGGAERVLWLPELYLRFVSNRLVRDIFADYQARELAAKKDRKS